MPETGQSWQRRFVAAAEHAYAARVWVAKYVPHEDAEQIAAELFNAVLGSRTATIEMTVSTAGRRTRISAAGDAPLALLNVWGPGGLIIRGIAPAHGTTPDSRGVWAEITRDPPR